MAGMYTALMDEIQQRVKDIKKNKRQVVKVNTSGDIISEPFDLLQEQQQNRTLQRTTSQQTTLLQTTPQQTGSEELPQSQS